MADKKNSFLADLRRNQRAGRIDPKVIKTEDAEAFIVQAKERLRQQLEAARKLRRKPKKADDR